MELPLPPLKRRRRCRCERGGSIVFPPPHINDRQGLAASNTRAQAFAISPTGSVEVCLNL